MIDLNEVKNGTELIIHTDDWIHNKDEVQYKRFWGICKIVEAKDLFGFKPTGDTNWYMQVGTGKDTMFIAGCRIHYVQVCKRKPINTNILCIN